MAKILLSKDYLVSGGKLCKDTLVRVQGTRQLTKTTILEVLMELLHDGAHGHA